MNNDVNSHIYKHYDLNTLLVRTKNVHWLATRTVKDVYGQDEAALNPKKVRSTGAALFAAELLYVRDPEAKVVVRKDWLIPLPAAKKAAAPRKRKPKAVDAPPADERLIADIQMLRDLGNVLVYPKPNVNPRAAVQRINGYVLNNLDLDAAPRVAYDDDVGLDV